eukprot:1190556-Prorocentrum_minimum.AAC.5
MGWRNCAHTYRRPKLVHVCAVLGSIVQPAVAGAHSLEQPLYRVELASRLVLSKISNPRKCEPHVNPSMPLSDCRYQSVCLLTCETCNKRVKTTRDSRFRGCPRYTAVRVPVASVDRRGDRGPVFPVGVRTVFEGN